MLLPPLGGFFGVKLYSRGSSCGILTAGPSSKLGGRDGYLGPLSVVERLKGLCERLVSCFLNALIDVTGPWSLGG